MTHATIPAVDSSRLAIALLANGLVTLTAVRIGQQILVVLLSVSLTVIAAATLTIAPDAIALQRGRPWRWWWRSSDDEGPYWPGTRIPRSPRS